MKTSTLRVAALGVLGTLVVAGCSATPATPAWTYPPAPASTPAVITSALVAEVHRNPACSCCHEWEAYLRDAGWEVRAIDVEDMSSFKQSHELPESTWSCHTAIIDGYVVEGHVPLAAIEDLLAARPAIDGIALAGMPPGSPGMPGDKEAPFAVVSVTDGVVAAFGSY